MKISKDVALKVLNAALKTGGDYAEIYYQDARGKSYTRKYKKVESITGARSCGVGIRILKNDQVIYGFTSDISEQSLLELATSLSYGLEGEQILQVKDLILKKHNNINKIKISHNSLSDEEKIGYLEKAEKAAFDYSSSIVDVASSISEKDELVEIYNSDGIMCTDNRVRTRIFISVTASDGTQFQQSSFGPGKSVGLELLDEIDLVEKAKQCAKEACQLLTAADGPSGEMPVVLGNYFGGVLFHEACGHPLEGYCVSRNLSPFSQKRGKQIASKCVSAIDDGTIENGWGSENVDDEGNTPTRNQLIKDGILVNYMVDRYSARNLKNAKPTGACRRQGYRYTPTTRMTNTFIDNGKNTPEEVIASIKDGIYCKGFTGGQVDPATDQFVFTSDIAYTIKDGKIDKMIKPVSLIGYGYEILQRITMVANDLQRAPGMCGSSSGTCCVEVGQPTLAISKMIVGGR